MVDQGRGADCIGFRRLWSFIDTSVFYHRLILLICATVLFVAVFKYKSRLGGEHSARSAFSVQSSSYGYVRIAGDVRHAGIFPLSANTMTTSVIKMAEPLSQTLEGLSESDACGYLLNGMSLEVRVRPDGTLQLIKGRMTTAERLIMGIPLDINSMSAADFDKVPGIGPKLAQMIVVYRQNNGGRMAVTDLISINGIGEKKYKHLLNYF